MDLVNWMESIRPLLVSSQLVIIAFVSSYNLARILIKECILRYCVHVGEEGAELLDNMVSSANERKCC
jgi:hypothetical protein